MRINLKMPMDDDLYTSVFNANNNAVRKANKAFIALYGKSKFEKIKKINKTGLMAGFNTEPTPELIMYYLMITQTMLK